MLIRTIECDVCRKPGPMRATSNVVRSDTGDRGIHTDDWFRIELHEPAGAERGQTSARTIQWHLCGHVCLAKWCESQARARANALTPAPPPIGNGETP